MKAFITQGRGRSGKTGAATMPGPPPPQAAAQRPAPQSEPPQAQQAAPRPAARPLTVPRVSIPANLGQWGMLIVWGFLLKISVDATNVTTAIMVPGADWTIALYVQAAISLVERFHFAGNRNLFTWGCFVADTLMVAAGLALGLIPRFFQTPVWAMIAETTGLSYTGIDGPPLLGMALLIGAFVAYSGDKALDLAMGK